MSPAADKILDAVLSDLQAHVDADHRHRIADHFKLDVRDTLGVPTPIVRQISAEHSRAMRQLSLAQVLKRCEVLLKSGIYECKLIAFDWSFRRSAQLEICHFEVFESWLQNYVTDWADCDDLCVHSLGFLVASYSGLAQRVIPWTGQSNWWMRRAAAVSLIYGLRRNLLRAEALSVAKNLLDDEDDLVQKGYGWMLKEATKYYPVDILEFVLRYQHQMPKRVVRTAIAKLPDPQRQQFLRLSTGTHSSGAMS